MNDDDPTADAATRLQALLTRLDDEQPLAAENARTVTLDPTSVGRLSRIDAMQQQAMAQAALLRLATQRRKVAAALDRLQQGRYGCCCACGEVVGAERLRSDPAAPLCRDCQDERDAQRAAAR